MDFIFGFVPDSQDRTGILVFVDRFSTMTLLLPVHASITAVETAAHFVDAVFRHHGFPENIFSDRDPQFTSSILDVIVRASTYEAPSIESGSSETDEKMRV